MSAGFIRVSNGDGEEIIRADHLIKVYTAEGHGGKAIIYEFVRFGHHVSQWREEYPTAEARDLYFYKLVEVLCGHQQVPLRMHTNYRIEENAKIDYQAPEDLSDA